MQWGGPGPVFAFQVPGFALVDISGKVDNTTGFGGVRRVINAKITQLDEHLTVRYYFVGPKTCGGGSPRIQLAIDTDGEGVSNGNAFGSIGPSPSFTGCQMNEWVTEDLTISVLEGTQSVGRWSSNASLASPVRFWLHYLGYPQDVHLDIRGPQSADRLSHRGSGIRSPSRVFHSRGHHLLRRHHPWRAHTGRPA